MEAQELMVGDLCCEWNNDHTEKHVVKVAQIQKEGVRDRYNVFHENDWIEPIPWTAESAKKNGFEKYAEKTYRYFKADDKSYYTGFESVWYYEETSSFNIVKEEVNGFQNTIKIKKQYYHELQHALRLVGLNELADNLKV